MEEPELYYDLAKFEIEMLTTRSNFLLVFQSLLIAAVAVLGKNSTNIPQRPLIYLGVLSSFFWFYINLLTVVQAAEAIKRFKDLNKPFKEVLNSRREKLGIIGHGSISWIFAIAFPFLTFVMWIWLLIS